MKHTTSLMGKAIHYADTKSKEDIKEILSEDFNDQDIDDVKFRLLKDLFEKCTPGSQDFTPNQLEDRRKIIEKMRKVCVAYFADHSNNVHVMKTIDAPKCRELSTLFKTGPDSSSYNLYVSQIIRERDPEKLHGLFDDMMVKLATLDIDKVNHYTDAEFVKHFDEFFPVAFMGMESEGIISALKSYGCQFSPEEEKHFNQLRIRANDFCMKIYNKADILMSPYYLFLDHKAVKNPDYDIKETISKTSESDDELSNYVSSLEGLISDELGQPSKDIAELMMKTGDYDREGLTLSPYESGKKLYTDRVDEYDHALSYEDTFQHVKDLKEGKKVYAVRYTEKPNASRVVHAFKMNKNGVIYEVPMVVKPGIFDYIVDFFSRLFGGEGNKIVNDYKNRDALEAAVDNQNKDKLPGEEYQEAIDYVKSKYPSKITEISKEEIVQEKFDLLKTLQKRNEILTEMFKGDETFRKDEEKSMENSRLIENEKEMDESQEVDNSIDSDNLINTNILKKKEIIEDPFINY